jgi:hypothetical protein
MPPIDGKLTGWSDAELVPKLGAMDAATDFADVWACWNESGLAVACRVEGKRRPLHCDPMAFWTGDNLRLCTDMRDARNNKRATRFCQQFYFLPTGGGAGGRQPVAGTNRFKRAIEHAPAFPEQTLRVASTVTRAGYSLEAFIPADCLSGLDPAEHPRIGFYYILEDGELGQQYLTVGDDLDWYVDPSTWATAVLAVPPSSGPGRREHGPHD